MKEMLSMIAVFFFSCIASGQSALDVIRMVKEAQAKINTIHYIVNRSDTFVTGQTRISQGEVKMKSIATDTLFGFAYWAKKNGINTVTIYDGQAVFDIDNDKKIYSSDSEPFAIEHSLGSPGGQMVMPDVIRIDTSTASSFGLTQDDQFYFLTAILPDITQYDVIKRSKTFRIDKKLLLPTGIRTRQETLGKIQDINYSISDIQVNDPSYAYDFSTERFPPDYTRHIDQPNAALLALKGNKLPAFELASFNGADKISNNDLKGKIVLLDFWEVWCGPCIASMPKVQALQEKYGKHGLAIYGVMSEKDQLEPARLLVKKRNISFPMLLSNPAVNDGFGIMAVPTYILVDKHGVVRFTSEGFSEELEGEIKQLLK